MIRHSTCDKYCVFVRGSGWYALPALAVREIAPCPVLFRVPATDAALAGICQLRNEFLAIVRLDLLQAHQDQANRELRQLLLILPAFSQGGKILATEEKDWIAMPGSVDGYDVHDVGNEFSGEIG